MEPAPVAPVPRTEPVAAPVPRTLAVAVPRTVLERAAELAGRVPVAEWLAALVEREADRRAAEAERQRSIRARKRQQGASDAA